MTQQDALMSTEEQIREVIESLTQAIGAKDVDRTVAHFGPAMVEYSLAPPLEQPDASGLSPWFDTWNGPIGVEIYDLRISASADIAFCSSLCRLTGTKVDGAEIDMWYRATHGLHKVGNRWLIVHEHQSVPFYMDGSFRAVVDLIPEVRSHR